MQVFELNHTVTPKDIDHLDHVNNIVYLEWIQNVAYKHWNLMIDNDIDYPYVWYVIKHEIDYLKQAILGDLITIKTWVGEAAGVKSTRYVDIFKGDVLLAKAKTTFCMLDVKTKRPARITESVLKLLKPLK